MVPIDGEKIKQALINLVQNSLDAMVNGGQISLEAKIIEHSNFSNIYSTLARIRITDSGPGIPPDLREKVFEPFFTSKKTGTGLGLAIARDIIEEHGGHIRITDSLVEGVTGITFELDFPLQPTLKGGVS